MKNYEQLFSTLNDPEPPAGLARDILVRIQRRERRVLAMKIAASGLMFAGSVFAIVMGYENFQASAASTGFLQFMSLLFSDFSLISSNLPDFLLSIVESFPVFSSAVMLGGAGFAIWSLAAVVDEVTMVETHKFSLLS